MSLGHFGGSAPRIKRVSGYTGGHTSEALGEAMDLQEPSPEGMPAASEQVMLALRNISHNLVFSATDFDTVAWATGTITMSDATAYSISAGNTGTMAARTYIYLDVDTSETVLQTSTTFSDAVGNRKYLLASAVNVADATKFATFQVFSGIGGLGGTFITAGMIGALSITATEIADLAVTTAKINTLAVTTAKIAALAVTSAEIDALAVTTAKIDNLAVTTSKIAALAVTSAELGALSVTTAKLDNLAVTAAKIAALTITAAEIANLTVVAGKIAALTITSGKFDIDDVAWNNLLQGGGFESWSAGTAAAPDFWTLTGAGATVAQDLTTVKGIGVASCDFTAALNTATDLAQSLVVSATTNATLRGTAVTFSCQVKAGTASRVSLKIDDGVGTTSSSNHTGGGTFELLSVTRTLDASATKCECSIEVSSGASMTVTVDDAMLFVGSTPLAFSLNFLDKALAISSYQDEVPTSVTDQGVWRAEIGRSSATSVAANNASTTVTFQTAFRTIRVVLITLVNTASAETLKVIKINGFAAANFTWKWETDDGSSVSDGIDVFFLAIGQV